MVVYECVLAERNKEKKKELLLWLDLVLGISFSPFFLGCAEMSKGGEYGGLAESFR